MTLARPLLLAALASLPVLWWLARRAAARRDLPVSSLLLWRRVGLAAEPPRESRRRTDLLLWLRMAAAAAIALGMAGPVIRGTPASPILHVLLDVSPSMSAFEENAARALAEIGDSAAGVTVEVHRREGVEDLPAILAAAGSGDVVVVTDHRTDGIEAGGRLRLVLVGESVENVGFRTGWVEDGKFTAVVTNFGTEEREVAVVHGGGRVPLSIPAGKSRTATGEVGVLFDLPLRIDPGDRFAFDDEIVVAVPVNWQMTVAWRGADEPRLRTALEVAGLTIGTGNPGVAYRVAPEDGDFLVVAAPGRTRTVSGAVVAGEAVDPAAVPPAGTVLGPVTILPPGGRVLLADHTGPLAVRRADARVEEAIDPGHPESTWFKDPSFPIFWAQVVRGPEPGGSRLADPTESATRGESAPIDLGGLTPSSPPPPGERDFTRWLLLFAAALLAAHVWLERRGSQ